MKFLERVDRERYDFFVRNHPKKSHFLQSYAWGQLMLAARGQTPHYVGMEDKDGRLAAAALLLEHRPKCFPLYLYSPRGFVLDFDNDELLGAFTAEVAAFAARLGAMFFTIDPDVERWDILEDGSKKDGGRDNTRIVRQLLSLGFRHGGFTLGFEGRQPRYTFRIDLEKDDAEIDRGFRGNVQRDVKKSCRYGTSVIKGGEREIGELSRLLRETGERKQFVGPDERYIRTLWQVMAAEDMADLYLGKVDLKETAVLLQQELAVLLSRREAVLHKPGQLQESELREQRLLREIEKYAAAARQTPEPVVCSAHLMIRYGGKAWALYAGSDRGFSETLINTKVYHEKIHDMKKKGVSVLDQFGTIGNPAGSKLKPLHDFKRQFGGRYMEFIGEFDYVLRPAAYAIYKKVLPLYRNLLLTVRTPKKTRGEKSPRRNAPDASSLLPQPARY